MFLVQLLRVVWALAPLFWFGWSAKGLAEWFYPSRMSYSEASGGFATFLLWSGIAAGLVSIFKVLYPEKPVLAAVFQGLRDLWGWIRAQWEATNPSP